MYYIYSEWCDFLSLESLVNGNSRQDDIHSC